MAMLYELAGTWSGLYVVGRTSCLFTVMYTFMMLINSGGDEERRVVMEVGGRLTVVIFSLCGTYEPK